MTPAHRVGQKLTVKQCDRISGVRILFKLMKIMGLWQWKENEEESQCNQVLERVQRFCIHVPFTFVFIALMWVEVFTSSDLDDAGDVLHMSITEAAVIVKLLNMWHHSDKAWRFVNELSYGQNFDLFNREEIELWQRKQKQFFHVLAINLAVTIFAVVSGVMSTMFSESYQLPFAYWVPFDWHTNNKNYRIAYAYDALGISVTAATNVSMDMVGSYFLFHTSILYQILGLRLRRLKIVAEENVETELRKIFKFHMNVRRITRDCETLISTYVLSQIVFSAFILCFSGYRMLKIRIVENFGQYLSMLQFVFLMVLEIYLPCYYGNEIIGNSAQLRSQVYSSEWLRYPIKTRKLLFLYMEFAKHPEKVRAGNYFDVGLPVFTKVLNNAYSVFALIMNAAK